MHLNLMTLHDRSPEHLISITLSPKHSIPFFCFGFTKVVICYSRIIQPNTIDVAFAFMNRFSIISKTCILFTYLVGSIIYFDIYSKIFIYRNTSGIQEIFEVGEKHEKKNTELNYGSYQGSSNCLYLVFSLFYR